MLTRVITSIVALCVLLPILFLADTWVLPVAVAVCCFIAIYEVLKCIGVLSKPCISVPLFILSVVAPIFVRIIGTLELYILTLMCAFLVEILYLMAVMVFSKGNITIEQTSVSARSRNGDALRKEVLRHRKNNLRRKLKHHEK